MDIAQSRSLQDPAIKDIQARGNPFIYLLIFPLKVREFPYQRLIGLAEFAKPEKTFHLRSFTQNNKNT